MSDRLDDARLASDERIAKLEASLAAAERRAEGFKRALRLNMDARAQAERRLALAKHWLHEIATRPTTERNPDGDEQAAWTMQLIARQALAALDGEGEAE